MTKYAKMFYEQICYDANYAQNLRVINIYKGDDLLFVHVLSDDGCCTIIYQVTLENDNLYFSLYRKEIGFIKTAQSLRQQVDKMSKNYITWLKRGFDEELLSCCKKANKIGNFKKYCYMVEECGGYYAAKTYINDKDSIDFYKLSNMGRMDLSIENLALRNKYYPLFSDKEREICQKRINRYIRENSTQKVQYYAF